MIAICLLTVMMLASGLMLVLGRRGGLKNDWSTIHQECLSIFTSSLPSTLQFIIFCILRAPHLNLKLNSSQQLQQQQNNSSRISKHDPQLLNPTIILSYDFHRKISLTHSSVRPTTNLCCLDEHYQSYSR